MLTGLQEIATRALTGKAGCPVHNAARQRHRRYGASSAMNACQATPAKCSACRKFSGAESSNDVTGVAHDDPDYHYRILEQNTSIVRSRQRSAEMICTEGTNRDGRIPDAASAMFEITGTGYSTFMYKTWNISFEKTVYYSFPVSRYLAHQV